MRVELYPEFGVIEVRIVYLLPYTQIFKRVFAAMANLFVFGTQYLSLMVLSPHFLLTLFILIFNMQ